MLLLTIQVPPSLEDCRPVPPTSMGRNVTSPPNTIFDALMNSSLDLDAISKRNSAATTLKRHSRRLRCVPHCPRPASKESQCG